MSAAMHARVGREAAYLINPQIPLSFRRPLIFQSLRDKNKIRVIQLPAVVGHVKCNSAIGLRWLRSAH